MENERRISQTEFGREGGKHGEQRAGAAHRASRIRKFERRGQHRAGARVIDELEARINDARRVPMSKTLSIIDTGELIDLIGQLRIVLPHTVVQAQAILDERKKILGEAKEEAKASTAKRTPITPKRWKTPNALSRT